LRRVAHPVTGGGKTPLTPIRRVPQLLSASGGKTRIPFLFIFRVRLMTPLELAPFVLTLIPAPLIRTRMPLTPRPVAARGIGTRVLRPTIRWPGVIFLMLMHGSNGTPVISTCAVAVLLLRFVSGLSPDTTAVLVCVPVWLGVVTRVIVICWPAVMVPRLQFR